MYVQHRFELSEYTKQYIRDLEPEFGYNGYGELIFFRTYSRYLHDEERQETWHDVVIRAIEGTLSIRKDWYIKNHISWNERRWQKFAFKFAIAMFKMHWMPPGRGLWAMGTDFVYERGAMALYNCHSYETPILTRKGVYPIGRLAGAEVEVLSKTDTGYHWIKTKVNQYGSQSLVRLTTTDGRSVVCTADHNWPLADDRIKTTNQLVAGDQLICYNQPGIEVESVSVIDRTEDVYCCEVPVWHNFVLGNGIVTGNCSATELGKDLATDIGWMMDCLMLGVGVGFSPTRDNSLTFKRPTKRYDFIIPDSREGWVESVVRRIYGYMKGDALPNCIYDEVRPAGLPIRGFGGVSSGPRPLKEFHYQIDELIERYMEDPYYDSVMLKTDLANLTGKCVVAGNVRRSAELGSLSINDPTFINLKDYTKYPYRESWGGMSNNSVDLFDDEDFERLDEIADRVKVAGEPGFKNLRNFQFGRLGKRDNVRRDPGRLINPCGEEVLDNKEVCNVDETCPTRCPTIEDWYKACEYATFYASTVSLLPTHQPATNRVVARNRRIGVSIIDVSGWKDREGVNKVTKYLREGYQIVRKTNRYYNGEAGVPESIRVTTIKPGGTVPKLVGRTSGAGYPTFRYTNRRTRVAANSAFAHFLINHGLTYEPDVFDPNTFVFDYPIIQGPAKPGSLVPLWQQAMDIVWLQREWSDSAVSNTLYFKPKWVLSQIFATSNELVSYLESKMLNHNEYVMVLAKLHTMEEEIEVEDLKITITYDEESDQITKIKIYRFDPAHEEDSIEPVLSMIAPVTKSVSLLPHTPDGVYKQMPESGLTEQEYLERLARLPKIDWTLYNGKTDGIDERYCQGDQCERIV